MAKERKGKARKGKKRKGKMNWPNGREGRGEGGAMSLLLLFYVKAK